MSLPTTSVAESPGTADAARGRRRRVLHVINGEHYSGAERVQDLLALRLPEFGFEVGFACVKPGKFAACRLSIDTPLHELPMSWRGDLRVAFRLADLARRGQYDLLHAHTPRSALVARVAAALTGLPMVYHVHSPAARDTESWWRNRVNHLSERLSLARVARFVTVSKSLGTHMLAAGYRADRISVVPNGVPAATRHRSDQPPGATWTLGTVALFRPRKGLEVLLEALALLRRESLDARLLAVGGFETPAYEQHIRQQVRRLDLADAIEWTGFTRAVDQQLTRMDLFVLPSLYGEGLPMVVLEAMAAGVPVIGTRVEGVPEVIDHGVNGLVADPNSPDDLARAVRQVTRGDVDWQIMRRHAIDHHAEHFSDHRMAEALARVYHQIIQVPVML